MTEMLSLPHATLAFGCFAHCWQHSQLRLLMCSPRQPPMQKRCLKGIRWFMFPTPPRTSHTSSGCYFRPPNECESIKLFQASFYNTFTVRHWHSVAFSLASSAFPSTRSPPSSASRTSTTSRISSTKRSLLCRIISPPTPPLGTVTPTKQSSRSSLNKPSASSIWHGWSADLPSFPLHFINAHYGAAASSKATSARTSRFSTFRNRI